MRTCSKCGLEKAPERFVGARCPDCMAAYKRAYYQANRAKINARATEWGRAHPERRREITQGWLERNPDKRREVTARSAQRPEAKARRRETAAQWRKANPERMRSYNWRASTRRGNRFRAGPLVEWVDVLYSDPCCYCGGPGGEIDHIVPIDADGQTQTENLTSACRSCNAKKHTRPLLTYLLATKETTHG